MELSLIPLRMYKLLLPLGAGYAEEGNRRSNWRTYDDSQPYPIVITSVPLTSPSSEHVRKTLGEDSVTIRFTLSVCDLYTLAFVFPSLRYLTPSWTLLNWGALPEEAKFDRSDGIDDRPLYSRSKTLTSASPAHVTSVRSFEWGINFTENIFAEWPVDTVVVRAN